jgi:hypothetical protein
VPAGAVVVVPAVVLLQVVAALVAPAVILAAVLAAVAVVVVPARPLLRVCLRQRRLSRHSRP